QDQQLASIHAEECPTEVGSPLPADAVTAQGAVEARPEARASARRPEQRSRNLIELLKDPRKPLRKQAVQALEEIDAKAAAAHLQFWSCFRQWLG
ncbi:MAG TPA: hypothetical protein VKJ47_06020, partial [Candidatus Binatia bacterium]|nr:hypothetical protein [Candidatus Binatia bacterium]